MDFLSILPDYIIMSIQILNSLHYFKICLQCCQIRSYMINILQKILVEPYIFT